MGLYAYGALGASVEVRRVGHFVLGVRAGYEGEQGYVQPELAVVDGDASTLQSAAFDIARSRVVAQLPWEMRWLRITPFGGLYQLSTENIDALTLLRPQDPSQAVIGALEGLTAGGELDVAAPLGDHNRLAMQWTAERIKLDEPDTRSYARLQAHFEHHALWPSTISVMTRLSLNRAIGARIPRAELPTLGGSQGLKGFRPDRFRDRATARTLVYAAYPIVIPSKMNKTFGGGPGDTSHGHAAYSLGPTSAFIENVVYGIGPFLEVGGVGERLGVALAERELSGGVALWPLTDRGLWPALDVAFSKEDYFVTFSLRANR